MWIHSYLSIHVDILVYNTGIVPIPVNPTHSKKVNKMTTNQKENQTNPDEYNGWTNYETWCINLWLTDNPGDYHYLTNLATSPHLTDYQKADQLRADIEDTIPDDLSGLLRDLLLSSISSCNFHEIIKSVQEDQVDEEDQEEEE